MFVAAIVSGIATETSSVWKRWAVPLSLNPSQNARIQGGLPQTALAYLAGRPTKPVLEQSAGLPVSLHGTRLAAAERAEQPLDGVYRWFSARSGGGEAGGADTSKAAIISCHMVPIPPGLMGPRRWATL